MDKYQTSVDHGWAWVVMLAALGAHALIGGACYSISVLNVLFLEAFKDSRANTAWIGSLTNALLSSGGVVSSVLVSRLGFRWTVIIGGLLVTSGCVLSIFCTSTAHLMVTYGLITGMGFGLCVTPMCSVIGYYFKKYLILAAAVASIGAGIGSFFMAPLVQKLAEEYDWRGAMLILGAIELHLCLCGALIRPVSAIMPADDQNSDSSQETKTENFTVWEQYTHLLRNKRFIMICLSNFTISVGQWTVYVHLSAFAISWGANHDDAAILMSITGIFSIAARLSVSCAATDKNIGALLLAAGSMGVNGLVILLSPFLMPYYWGQVLVAVLFGYYGNAYVPLLTSITADSVGLSLLTPAYAGQMLTHGVGALVGPPVAGWIYDVTLSYQYGFFLAGSLLVLSSIFLLIIPTFPRSPDLEPELSEFSKEEVLIVNNDGQNTSNGLAARPKIEFTSNLSLILVTP